MTHPPFYRDPPFLAAFTGGFIASAAYNQMVYAPEFLTTMTVAIIVAVPCGFIVRHLTRSMGRPEVGIE